jgi:hypothetical protein
MKKNFPDIKIVEPAAVVHEHDEFADRVIRFLAGFEGGINNTRTLYAIREGLATLIVDAENDGKLSDCRACDNKRFFNVERYGYTLNVDPCFVCTGLHVVEGEGNRPLKPVGEGYRAMKNALDSVLGIKTTLYAGGAGCGVLITPDDAARLAVALEAFKSLVKAEDERDEYSESVDVTIAHVAALRLVKGVEQ